MTNKTPYPEILNEAFEEACCNETTAASSVTAYSTFLRKVRAIGLCLEPVLVEDHLSRTLGSSAQLAQRHIAYWQIHQKQLRLISNTSTEYHETENITHFIVFI